MLNALQCDLVGDIDRAFLDSFCEANGFSGWFETSAKENKNITESGKKLVEHVLMHRDIFENIQQARNDVFQASAAAQNGQRSSSSWCCNI